MTALACALLVAAVGVYAVRAWQAVRMAQLTDSSVRAEWTEYRAEVDGALDESLRRLNTACDELKTHDGRIDTLEKAKRSEALGRIARTG